MAEFFAMGGYATYVWPAYGITVLVLTGLVVATLARRHRSRHSLTELEERRGRRKQA
jgi:heme exporter protein D